ncbi:hypothetical protein [Desmospora activa]|uniref:Uncharacterized protein n=1 Tax=Desmospora activa DSM 45169 TaxID=1121389 RepID=A0A2T4Z7P9_9BACL|nr:hypothetical protein [Desmospora activa]PTM57895.1 hypothetical protein C8J48_0460 [Desmospora activa DSM 45169]
MKDWAWVLFLLLPLIILLTLTRGDPALIGVVIGAVICLPLGFALGVLFINATGRKYRI